MAGKDISFKVSAKDEATSTLNKVAGSVNSFSKETKEALKPVDNLNKSFASITKSFAPLTAGVVAAVAAVKNLSASVTECTNVWAQNEIAMKRIDFAGKVNPALRSTTAELKNFANELSALTNGWYQSGEVMESMTTLLYDKTTPQIKEIISAATDLSIAMGTDLNSAVTQLNNTFAGNVGTLGKMFPELKKLTAAELEAGDAVRIVAERVAGASKEFTNTIEGTKKAAQDASDALKSAFGDMFSYLTQPMTQFFTKMKNNLTTLINNTNNVRRALNSVMVADAQTRFDSAQTLQNNAKSLRDQQESYLRTMYAAEGMPAEQIWKSVQSDSTYMALDADISKYGAIMAAALAEIKAATDNGVLSVELSNTTESTNALAGVLEGAMGIAAPKFFASNVNLGSTLNLPGFGNISQGVNTGAPSAMSAFDYTGGAVGVDGRFALVKFFEDELMPALEGFWEGLSSVTALMDPLNTVFESFMQTLGPAINSTLAPLVGMLTTIGSLLAQTLMPVLDILAPVISDIADAFVWLYNNVLRNFGNAIISLINMLGNVLVFFNNMFAWLPGISKKEYRSLDAGALGEISTGDLASSGMSYMNTMSGSGGASYSAARDVTVNINYSHSFVNGDAQEIAIQIKRELSAISALGY